MKKEYLLTEQLMRRAISLNPAHARHTHTHTHTHTHEDTKTHTHTHLTPRQVKKEYLLTEQLMRRAISLNPAHVDALSHFGTFLGKVASRLLYQWSPRKRTPGGTNHFLRSGL